jgi:hypothetical protein
VLRWFYTPGFDVTRRLLAGEIEISHRGLDVEGLEAPKPVAFVRAALVDCGVLEPRDEFSARFAAWQADAVLAIAPGPDRAHVRAYATWQVAHKLARSVQRRGESSYSSLKWAKSLVNEPIKLVIWLHELHLELAGLRQDLVDEWVAGGSMNRRRIRPFLQWLERAGVIGHPEVAWDDRLPTRAALGDAERFAILRRLLHDHEIDLRDRFAGGVLLLYGKPFTQIAALRTSAIGVDADGQTAIQLGRGAIPVPEPLGAISLALRYQQLERTGADGWLLPGRHAGTHITADPPRPAPALRHPEKPTRTPPRRTARARRQAPRADPRRADRDPPVPRRAVGPARRRHLGRVRAAAQHSLRPTGRARWVIAAHVLANRSACEEQRRG